MGLIDRLLGHRDPDAGAVPVPAPELHRRLLALHRPDTAWVIRPGTPERVHVVAEWEARVGRTTYHYTILVLLDERRREARTLEKITESGPNARWGRGPVNLRAVSGGFERDEHGRRRFVTHSGFESRLLKDPLRDTVTASGWRWRARLHLP